MLKFDKFKGRYSSLQAARLVRSTEKTTTSGEESKRTTRASASELTTTEGGFASGQTKRLDYTRRQNSYHQYYTRQLLDVRSLASRRTNNQRRKYGATAAKNSQRKRDEMPGTRLKEKRPLTKLSIRKSCLSACVRMC